MISALIRKGANTLVIDLPTGLADFQVKLLSAGIREQPERITLSDDEDDLIRVKLFSNTEAGNHLIQIFAEYDTLADANITASMISSSNDRINLELERRILNDHYNSPRELLRDIKELNDALGKHALTFYCPLMVQIPDEDGELNEIDNVILLNYEEDIRDAIRAEQQRDNKNMAHYYWGNDGVKAKLISADWDVEQIGGELFGCIHIRLNEPLTVGEATALSDWVNGQNADGLCEGFEQRPIQTDDGELYISYWHSGDDYFLCDEDELEQVLSGRQEGGMHL